MIGKVWLYHITKYHFPQSSKFFGVSLLTLLFIHLVDTLRLFLILSLIASPVLLYSGTKTPLSFLETCAVHNNLFFYQGLIVHWCILLLHILQLIAWDLLTFIILSVNKWQCVKFRHFEYQYYFIPSYDMKNPIWKEIV